MLDTVRINWSEEISAGFNDLKVTVVSQSHHEWDVGAGRPAVLISPEQARIPTNSLPDVYLVDVMDEPQVTLVALLARGASQPVVVLGPGSGADVSRYLDAGAADYVTPETPLRERTARLRAAARRNSARTPADDDQLVIGHVSISLSRHEVRRRGEIVPFTPHEFQLLETLLETPNEVIPHRKLMVRVWGVENITSRHYLRVYIRQLRKKLEEDPASPTIIVTEWGRGYRICTENPPGAT